MSARETRPVGLVVTDDTLFADDLVHELRTLDWIAVSVDSCDVALEMMDVVAFSLVIVDVTRAPDWFVCRRLVDARRSPVAIITTFIADDRRYRRFAFHMGVAAYVRRLCARGRLREMLRRFQCGERHIEVVAEAAHSLSDQAKPA